MGTAMHRMSLIALSFATVALAACEQQQPPPEDNAAEEPVLNLPAIPRPDPPLDRASLLAAVAEAASAAASGEQLPETVRSLDGRQFEVRIRFGCRGPATELGDRWLAWSFDPESRRIRVQAKPTIAIDDPLVEEISGEEFEAVEGFWLPRPWLLSPVCPAGAAVQRSADGAMEPGSDQRQSRQSPDRQQAVRPPEEDSSGGQQAEPEPAPPRIGIAQFFTDQDPRTRRRDSRPYQASHTLAKDKAISSQGYNLVLSGRLRALPGRGVIQCVSRGADTPPECIVSAEFLRVWIEQPGTRDVIAEWGGG